MSRQVYLYGCINYTHTSLCLLIFATRNIFSGGGVVRERVEIATNILRLTIVQAFSHENVTIASEIVTLIIITIILHMKNVQIYRFD